MASKVKKLNKREALVLAQALYNGRCMVMVIELKAAARSLERKGLVEIIRMDRTTGLQKSGGTQHLVGAAMLLKATPAGKKRMLG